MLDCRGFDGRFPLRAANGRLTKARLLTLAKRAEACGGNRARALLHPTGNLAGGFAPCLACGWHVGPVLAGLGTGFLLR